MNCYGNNFKGSEKMTQFYVSFLSFKSRILCDVNCFEYFLK
jgi:hypothetical protein